jgi:hypothetical protein
VVQLGQQRFEGLAVLDALQRLVLASQAVQDRGGVRLVLVRGVQGEGVIGVR